MTEIRFEVVLNEQYGVSTVHFIGSSRWRQMWPHHVKVGCNIPLTMTNDMENYPCPCRLFQLLPSLPILRRHTMENAGYLKCNDLTTYRSPYPPVPPTVCEMRKLHRIDPCCLYLLFTVDETRFANRHPIDLIDRDWAVIACGRTFDDA